MASPVVPKGSAPIPSHQVNAPAPPPTSPVGVAAGWQSTLKSLAESEAGAPSESGILRSLFASLKSTMTTIVDMQNPEVNAGKKAETKTAVKEWGPATLINVKPKPIYIDPPRRKQNSS